MQLIVDENLHLFTVNILAEYGFDVLTIDDILDWGALDEEIYQYATDNNIAIITHDRRFGQFHYEATIDPPTTIVLEVIMPHPEETNLLLKQALDELKLLTTSKYHNKLIVINRNKIRIRD